MTCLLISTVAMIVFLWFAWAPVLMLFVLVGLTSVSGMAGVLLGFVILGAAALHSRLNGKSF